MHILVTSADGANGNGYGAILGFGPEGEFTGPFGSDPRIADPRGLSVDPSGVISHVSRTLRSISVCSPRPNRAGRARTILRLACGALTGKLTGPAPATVSRTSLAGTDSCALNAPGACEPSSTLASQPRTVSQSGCRGEDGIHPDGPGASPRANPQHPGESAKARGRFGAQYSSCQHSNCLTVFVSCGKPGARRKRSPGR